MLQLVHKETFGDLPTSEYELYDQGGLVGIIQIRHRPSCGVGIPKSMASHVYYEIQPAYRRQGYGKKILSLGLEQAEKNGLKELSITCVEDNVDSKKIIEANGGVFVDSVLISDMGKTMLKYDMGTSTHC